MKQSRIGESIVANNGQTMTIIDFAGTTDITVKFEDGTIVKNKNYQAFKRGAIRNPNKYHTLVKRKSDVRIGETNRSSCGLMMTIIAYRSAKDMDIKFEDGTVVEHVWYNRFLTGNIKHPIAGKDGVRLGLENVNNKGRKMKIVGYRNSGDIDIEFEDGTVVTNTSYYTFKSGSILHPSDKGPVHIGEEVVAKNGQKMTLIEWNSNTNVKVKFEDGTEVTTIYKYFKEGKVGNPNYNQYKAKRIGETVISKKGQKMTIIDYRKINDIYIKFEDGTIVTNKTYNNFKSGRIKNPNL